MERERFVSLKFRAYMEVWYIPRRLIEGHDHIECMLLACDFDNDVMKIQPISGSYFEEKEFWSSIEYIDLPKRKLKISR